jgi:hypothetical protein
MITGNGRLSVLAEIELGGPKQSVKAAVKSGLAIVLCKPGGKDPVCTEPPSRRNGKHPEGGCGRNHAITDPERAYRAFENAQAQYPGQALNIGVHARKSNLAFVDMDTPDELDAFIAEYQKHEGTDIPLTVSSPGAQDDDGNWVHWGAGHTYFDVTGIELPEDVGEYTDPKNGWVLKWGNEHVVAPPSERAEGRYTFSNPEVFPLPQFLIDRAWGLVKDRKPRSEPGEPTEIDEWAERTHWSELLKQEHGWVFEGRRDNCGCPIWWLYGHGDHKSATAHEAGCPRYDTSRGHGPLHLWTTVPPDFLRGEGKNFSKIQYLAHSEHHGNMKAAIRAVGIDPVRVPIEDLGWDPTEDEDMDEDDSWQPVDLGAVLDGTYERPTASIGHRSDGTALLYPGKEHSVFGEPEAGKGWFILHVAADELARDGTVLYVDFEDDEGTVVGRLHRDLGVPADDIKARFFYVRPDGPGVNAYPKLLDKTNPSLVILDGVTEGYGLHGWQIKENDDSPRWRAAFVKPAMRRGAATLSTDHVVKNKEARNGFAIGGQHKKAGLTGVLFELINLEPFGKGLKGRSRLVIHKDRNGDLRQHGVPDEKNPRITVFGDLTLDAREGLGLFTVSGVSLSLNPPQDGRSGSAPSKIDLLGESILFVLRQDGRTGRFSSERQVRVWLKEADVKHTTEDVSAALSKLESQRQIWWSAPDSNKPRPGGLISTAPESGSDR